MNAFPWGFRIVGPTMGARRRVNAAAAFRGYAALDQRAEVNSESYLSAFTFGAEFKELLDATGSCRGFTGACWSPWIWFDLDAADDVNRALHDAGRLATGLVERYQLEERGLLLFCSGAKGFHLGLPTSLFPADPSPTFSLTARRFAEAHAARFGIEIDVSIYDRLRAFRAPNSRHPKSGLYKRRLTFDQLAHLPLDRILELAKEPAAFELPMRPDRNERATSDWQEALDVVRTHAEVNLQRLAVANGMPTLNCSTLTFICEGAEEGDRHRLLFSAAANLAEFECPPVLAHALLTQSALDSGLPPREVRRQIDCGLANRATSASPLLVVQPASERAQAMSSPPTLDPSLPPNAEGRVTDSELEGARQSDSPFAGSRPSRDPRVAEAAGIAWESARSRSSGMAGPPLPSPTLSTRGPTSAQSVAAAAALAREQGRLRNTITAGPPPPPPPLPRCEQAEPGNSDSA